MKVGYRNLIFAYWWYDLAKTRAEEASVYWSHERPDGSLCSSVFKNEDIPYSYFGENLGRGYNTGESLVEQGFMNSPSHRSCMLNPKYKYVVVAHTKDANGVDHCAVIFLSYLDEIWTTYR